MSIQRRTGLSVISTPEARASLSKEHEVSESVSLFCPYRLAESDCSTLDSSKAARWR